MNLRLASLARRACRLVVSRGFGRIAAAVAIVASYLALHWAITAVTLLYEHNRFRAAPAFAANMVGAMDRLRTVAGRGGTPLSDAERSAVDEIERIAGWFNGAVPSGKDHSAVFVSLGTDALREWFSFRTSGVAPKPWPSEYDPTVQD